MDFESTVTYFGQNTPDVDTFIKQDTKEVQEDKDKSDDKSQVILLAEILKFLAGDNISKEAKNIFKKNGLSLEDAKGFFGGLVKKFSNAKEKFNNFIDKIKEKKKLIIGVIVAVGVIGIGAYIYITYFM